MAGSDNLIPYRFKPGAPGGPGRPMSLIRSVRAQTDDGDEIVAFMLAIMRGEVDIIYPARPIEKKVRLQGSKSGKGAA